MKILISGSTGFIGKALLDLAIKNPDYSEIYTISRNRNNNVSEYMDKFKYKAHFTIDLSIQSEVEWLFQQIQPDIFFHLAGNPIVKVDEKDINAAYRDNTLTTHNLVYFCPKGCKFVLASTVLVYGMFDRYNDSQFSVDEISIEVPNSVYAESKLAAEKIALLYCRREKIDLKIARLCANVGPRATHGVLRDFIAKAKSNNPYFEIIGDFPGSSKPFMYVYDTAALLINLAQTKDEAIVYNLCPSDNLSTLEISRIVQEELGTNKPVKWLGEKANWIGDDRYIKVNSIHELVWHYDTSEKAVREAIKCIK